MRTRSRALITWLIPCSNCAMLSPRITEMMTERYPNSSTEFDALCNERLVGSAPGPSRTGISEPDGRCPSRSPTPDWRYRKGAGVSEPDWHCYPRLHEMHRRSSGCSCGCRKRRVQNQAPSHKRRLQSDVAES